MGLMGGEDPITAPRVLVIDDDQALRLTLDLLLRSTHRVTTCGTAREALDRIAKGEEFDAILCDLMMRDVSGEGFYTALAETHPALLPRVVFLTGGAFSPAAQQFIASIPNTVIEKPFEFDALEAVIARVTAGVIAG